MMPEGATRRHSSGYIQRKVNGNWEYEHRLVAARTLCRSLKPGEVVHHRNGNKADNHPYNLAVYPSGSAHTAHAHAARCLICARCRAAFTTKTYSVLKAANGKRYPRRYCSRRCFVESLRGKPFSGIPGHPKGGYRA